MVLAAKQQMNLDQQRVGKTRPGAMEKIIQILVGTWLDSVMVNSGFHRL